MKIIDHLIDIAVLSSSFRKVLRYAYIRSEGFQYGSYNLQDEVELALGFIRDLQRICVIDAGANKGDWSRRLLQGLKGKVSNLEKLIIIEPQSIHMPLLTCISETFPNVIVEQVAVGSNHGAVTIYADRVGSELASLYNRNLKHFGISMLPQETVAMTTLDSLLHRYSIHHVDFLKLDCEGHELEVLKGAKQLLEQKAISVISFEFGGCNLDSRIMFKDFWELLVDKYNFNLYHLLPKRRLKRLQRYSEEMESFMYQNVIACLSGINPRWVVFD